MTNKINIKAQDGFQFDFLTSKADIVIGGGAAGAGKTFALLMDALRGTNQSGNYRGTIFRRTYPEISQPGGLWEESKKLYPYRGGIPNESKMRWKFLNSSMTSFSHLQHEKDLLKYQGAQIPYIGFDEVTHFTQQMFFYLLTRNRTVEGIRPVMRATCNPDPDSWVAEFVKWWINQETGYPIPERSGAIRYFARDNDAYIWGDDRKEVYRKAHHLFKSEAAKGVNVNDLIKTVTFIPGTIKHNKKLMESNPQYLANLLSQDEETRLRLLEGNWRIRADKSNLFDVFKIRDLFTNDYWPGRVDQKYITIDHARFGKDLCVMMTWHGFRVVRIDVMAKSDTNDILRVIREIRREVKGIPMSNIIIDQDGIGVKDSIGCRLFQAGARPHDVSREKVQVQNKRAQVYFAMADQVNEGNCAIDLNNIHVHEDGRAIKSTRILIRGTYYDISQMTIDDLRTIKREQFELDKPTRITTKEAQKDILNRSPDFGDAFAMRGEFTFVRQPKSIRKL